MDEDDYEAEPDDQPDPDDERERILEWEAERELQWAADARAERRHRLIAAAGWGRTP